NERDRRAIPVLRTDVLALLADLAPGAALDESRILAVLDDRQPRRSGDLRRLTVAATLREGTDLGLLGRGALSTPGRLLLEAHRAASPATRRTAISRVAAALAEALPEDVDHVLIQADLTIIAPGPLAASAARSLRLLADVESRGHATVYRISEASVRRALDAGWDAESIHGLLADLSRTPVPQPLNYLVDDTARRHGAVRVGSALSYIRSDNSEALAAVLADRRLRSLGLHRIADTVVVGQAPTSEVISALRSAGYAPAAESPDGTVVIRRPEERRVRTPKVAAATTVRRAPEEALVTAAVRTLRAGDAAVRPRGSTVAGPAGSPAPPSLSASAVASTLRQAIADTRPMWIGYADNDGTITQQIVDPIRLQAGVLTAFDHRTDTVRPFAVSRIMGLAEVDPDAVPSTTP
ncbi:MAG: helicase-associated domain-containing protein, partial [Actinomycetes bacterium]